MSRQLWEREQYNQVFGTPRQSESTLKPLLLSLYYTLRANRQSGSTRALMDVIRSHPEGRYVFFDASNLDAQKAFKRSGMNHYDLKRKVDIFSLSDGRAIDGKKPAICLIDPHFLMDIVNRILDELDRKPTVHPQEPLSNEAIINLRFTLLPMYIDYQSEYIIRTTAPMQDFWREYKNKPRDWSLNHLDYIGAYEPFKSFDDWLLSNGYGNLIF